MNDGIIEMEFFRWQTEPAESAVQGINGEERVTPRYFFLPGFFCSFFLVRSFFRE